MHCPVVTRRSPFLIPRPRDRASPHLIACHVHIQRATATATHATHAAHRPHTYSPRFPPRDAPILHLESFGDVFAHTTVAAIATLPLPPSTHRSRSTVFLLARRTLTTTGTMATSVSTPASAPASAPATAIATSSPICNGNASDTFDAAIDTVPQTLPTTFTSNYNDADAQEDAFASSYAHSQSHFSGLYPWPLGNSSTAHHHRRSSCSTFESLTTATPGFMLADGADTDPANPFQFSLNGSGSLWNEADFATACIPPRPFSAPALSSSLLTQADDMNGWLSAAIAVDDSLLSRFATARRTDSCSSGSPPAVAAATVAADASTADLSMPPVSATIPAVSPLPAVNTTSFMAATAAAAATATATDTPVTSSATPWSNSLLCGGGGGTEVTAATTTTPTGSLTSMPLDSFEAVHAPLTAQQHQQQPQPQPQTQPQTLHSTPLSDLRHLGFGDYGYLAEEGVDQDSTGWKWPASFASAANSCGGTLDFSSSSVPWSSLASSVYASSQPSSSVVSSPASHSASLAVYESGGVNVEDYEPQQKE